MRYIFLSFSGFLLPFCLLLSADKSLGTEYKPKFSTTNYIPSTSNEQFYTKARQLVQEQINLQVRIEKAIIHPDANQIRAVQGQATVYVKTTEAFLKRQYQYPSSLCISGSQFEIGNLSTSQTQIYCGLYTSSQELLRIVPVLDRLMTRRGEIGLVRELTLVSGERQSDLVLSLAPVVKPNLGKPARLFATTEPLLPKVKPVIIGGKAKEALAGYRPPIQPAITAPTEVLVNLRKAKEELVKIQALFPESTKFQNPGETLIALDHFAYDTDPQELILYGKFLKNPNTGIFRVLPGKSYQRRLNTVENRLQPRVSERYPFPVIGKITDQLTPKLVIQMYGDNFQLVSEAFDYGFIKDVGNIPLEKLDADLKVLPRQTRELFLNYQPPKQLEALQKEQRLFLNGRDLTGKDLTGKDEKSIILAGARAELNHTYIVRSLQFAIPEIVLNGKRVSPQQRRDVDKLLKMKGSDTVVAFRAVRERNDGSYTVLWKILNQMPEPKINDLEQYLKF
jgi:hypothetical protein